MSDNTETNTEKVDLDAPSGLLNLTHRQVLDWEARHRQFCKLAHRQPCFCSAWGEEDSETN
jgi:hypothetical protein